MTLIDRARLRLRRTPSEDEFLKLQASHDRLAAWCNGWRHHAMHFQWAFERGESTRQQAVDKAARLEDENRDLRRQLDGRKPLAADEKPTIPTPQVPGPITPVVRLGGPGWTAPFAVTNPGCVKPIAMAEPREPVTWKPQPAEGAGSEDDTVRLPQAEVA